MAGRFSSTPGYNTRNHQQLGDFMRFHHQIKNVVGPWATNLGAPNAKVGLIMKLGLTWTNCPWLEQVARFKPQILGWKVTSPTRHRLKTLDGKDQRNGLRWVLFGRGQLQHHIYIPCLGIEKQDRSWRSVTSSAQKKKKSFWTIILRLCKTCIWGPKDRSPSTDHVPKKIT